MQMDKKYCPLYEGEITQYDCHEISCGAKTNYIANDGLPPLVSIEKIRTKRQICLDCQGVTANETEIATHNDPPIKKEKKMSEDEIRRRLAGRAAEYLMFLDD
jgi:hypothetical protein